MSGLKKFVIWIVLLVVGYHGLNYVKVHTSGDIVTYKRFAKSLMDNDYTTVRQLSDPGLAEQLAAMRAERNKQFSDGRILFSYHEVVSQYHTRDGKTAHLIVDQVTRMDSGGRMGFWGDRGVRIRHRAELSYENHVWKVKSFSDPVMQ